MISSFPLRRTLLAAALVVATTLSLAASANAAGTASIAGGDVSISGGTSADTYDVDHNSLAYVITNTAGITAGPGCAQTSANVVTCALALPAQVTISAGSATVTANVPDNSRVTIQNGGVNAPNAVADIEVNPAVDPTAGLDPNTTVPPSQTSGVYIVTGYGADVVVIGGHEFSGTIRTGAGADSITVTTDYPKSPPVEWLQPDGIYTDGATTNDGQSWPVAVFAGSGGDYIDATGAIGGVYYQSESGCDLFLGGAGDDWANATAGLPGVDDDDTIITGAGNDEIHAYDNNNGEDMYYAGAGNDKFFAAHESAEEMFNGGPGVDRITFSANNDAGASYTMDGQRNDGYTGNDLIVLVEEILGTLGGGSNGITSVGDANANMLGGSPNDDTITGGPGADRLYGVGGNDTFYAWDGVADTVSCSVGTDTAEVDAFDTTSGCENLIVH